MTRTFRSDQRGVAAIEAALILPVILLMIAGIFEYSRVLLAEHMIRDIIDEAARSGVVKAQSTTAIETSVETQLAQVSGLNAHEVTVTETVTALTVTVDGTMNLFFGDFLPSNLATFSLTARFPR
ncbi:MAG: TadE/TadG family type IV pilus assembly protein [Solirubrobacterales bacterium]